MLTVSVFGLGYVGCVSLACLAESGYRLIGVDVNPTKVQMTNEGRSPIIEEGMAELMARGVRSGCISATTDAQVAVLGSDVSLICVGTPSRSNGSLNLDYVIRVSQEIGSALAEKQAYHVVVVRSTMLPGSCEAIVIPALEAASGKRAGQDFGVCYNPEFLREGSSIRDFYDPPFTVVGGDDERAIEVVAELYNMLEASFVVVPIKAAEMVKYASNAFHALKVTFANEIGNLCKQQGIDSHELMSLFCQDTKLNISPAYLRPGFAFGGSCLPKDLRALLYHARQLDTDARLLSAILPSNGRQVDLAYEMIQRTRKKRVGVLGFSFKAGTDDLRESPLVELIERLIGKGYQVTVYDRFVSLANLQGANRAYIQQEIPHIAKLMAAHPGDLLAQSDVLVIGNNDTEYASVLDEIDEGQTVIDLVRFSHLPTSLNGNYEGICW
jgi:GDP-mannose 6-dehydrogenase